MVMRYPEESEIPQRLKPHNNRPSVGAAKAVPLQNHLPLQNHRFALRMGFRYARGMSEEAGQAIVRARGMQPFESIADLAHRVPELRRDNLVQLASIGALNSIGCATAKAAQDQLNQQHNGQRLHRRGALWQGGGGGGVVRAPLGGIPGGGGKTPPSGGDAGGGPGGRA